jgi:hypothetical protein
MFISRHFGKCCSLHLPGKWIWDLQGCFYIDMSVVGVGRVTIYMVTLPYTADGSWNLENSSVLLAAQPWAPDTPHWFRKVRELVHVPLRFFPHKIGHIQNSFPQMTFFRRRIRFRMYRWHVTSHKSHSPCLTLVLFVYCWWQYRWGHVLHSRPYRTDGRHGTNTCTHP